MANLSNPIPGIVVEYRGKDAKDPATALHRAMQQDGIIIEAPKELGVSDARLGALEIVLTILATSAAKAVAEASLNQLERYFREKAEKQPVDVNVQIVIQPDVGLPKRFPATLRQLTTDAAQLFFAKIRSAITAL